MNRFIELANKIYKINPESCELLIKKMSITTFKKGSIFLKSGSKNSKVYFVAEGITRSYVTRDGEENTVWFSKSGEPVVMTIGTTAHTTSQISAEALTDVTLIIIQRDELEPLLQTNLDLCNWARILTEKHLFKLETTLSRDLYSSATERYEALVKESPELLQTVPLKYIASYLMIRPESLSRIRRKLVSTKRETHLE